MTKMLKLNVRTARIYGYAQRNSPTRENGGNKLSP